MHLDLLFDPFGARWADVLAGAREAEVAGFSGLWTYDHLAGSVHGAPRVLEAWTVLSSVAASVPRLAIGPLVLNVANRDAGVVAVAAATLQEISGGRLLLGLGAGGGRATPYAAEQLALGRTLAVDAVRRKAVIETVTRIREVWSGEVGGVGGFLRPEPAPPIIVGGFGPQMALLAGRHADGINLPGGPQLVKLLAIARRAREETDQDAATFVVTASADPTPRSAERLADLGVDRMIVRVGPPFTAGVREVAGRLGLG